MIQFVKHVKTKKIFVQFVQITNILLMITENVKLVKKIMDTL